MRILTITFLCLAAGHAAAPPPARPPALTVDGAVALAVKQNPRLSAAARDVLAAQTGLSEARALTNPLLTFTPIIAGTDRSHDELVLRQPLEINGTRSARAGIAGAELRQTRATAVAELRDLVAATKTAYYELAKARGLLALNLDLLKIAQHLDQTTQRQVELGSRPGIDQTQAQIQAARAGQQVAAAQSDARIALAALNTLMGRAADAPIGALSPLAFNPVIVDGAAALRQALASRAEIVAAEARRDEFRQQARLFRAQGRPDLAPELSVGSVTGGFRDLSAGIGITLPLIDYGSRRNAIRQSEEAARAQTARIAETRNTVEQEVASAIARLSAAESLVRSYQQGVLDQSRRLLDSSRVGFDTGQTSVLAVLEAQRTYLAVQTEYITALASCAQDRAELERATGAIPPVQPPIAGPATRRVP